MQLWMVCWSFLIFVCPKRCFADPSSRPVETKFLLHPVLIPHFMAMRSVKGSSRDIGLVRLLQVRVGCSGNAWNQPKPHGNGWNRMEISWILIERWFRNFDPHPETMRCLILLVMVHNAVSAISLSVTACSTPEAADFWNFRTSKYWAPCDCCGARQGGLFLLLFLLLFSSILLLFLTAPLPGGWLICVFVWGSAYVRTASATSPSGPWKHPFRAVCKEFFFRISSEVSLLLLFYANERQYSTPCYLSASKFELLCAASDAQLHQCCVLNSQGECILTVTGALLNSQG